MEGEERYLVSATSRGTPCICTFHELFLFQKSKKNCGDIEQIEDRTRIIGIFPILRVAKLKYFGIRTIYPILYGGNVTEYTDSRHTVWDKSLEWQDTSTLQHEVWKNSYNLLTV